MTDSTSPRDAHRTFSQRSGYEPVPAPMRLEEVSRDLRRDVWNAIRELLIEVSKQRSRRYYFSGNSRLFVQRILGAYRRVPEDEVESPGEHSGFVSEWSNDVASEFKKIVLESKFHQLLDFVELVVGDRDVDDGFGVGIASLFDRHAAAYWLDVSEQPYRFFPRSNRAQGDAARNSIKMMRRAGMGGAEAHLRQAAEHINSRRYAESVKDSILAVESVARVIDPKAEKTLGPALKSLEKSGVIRHAALKEAFLRLYGYTNDEQGIRHALVDKSSPSVGVDEAMFMFGACASFAAYLTNKHQQSTDASKGDGGE